MNKLDDTDYKILELLQRNAKMTNLELAEAINLSPTPCARRVKRLEDDGIIQRYVTLINPDAIGLKLTVYLAVTLEKHSSEYFELFEKAVKAFPEVVECSVVTGRKEDLLLKIVARDMQHYEDFLLKEINTLSGVKTVHTSFQLRDIISNAPVPLFNPSEEKTRKKPKSDLAE